MATSKTAARKPAGKTVVRKTSTSRAPTHSSSARKAATTKTATKKVAVKKPAPAVTPEAKTPKAKKSKLVRDSFTIPKSEYEAIHTLKTRGQKMGHAVKKSELLRAGIKLLLTLNDAAFKAALLQVPVIKTGRPKSAK